MHLAFRRTTKFPSIYCLATVLECAQLVLPVNGHAPQRPRKAEEESEHLEFEYIHSQPQAVF